MVIELTFCFACVVIKFKENINCLIEKTVSLYNLVNNLRKPLSHISNDYTWRYIWKTIFILACYGGFGPICCKNSPLVICNSYLIKFPMLNHLQQVKCWFFRIAFPDFIQLAFVDSRSPNFPWFSSVLAGTSLHMPRPPRQWSPPA